MRTLPIVALLAACQVPEPSMAPEQAPPPPYLLELTPMFVGQQASMWVDDLTPGSRVVFAVSGLGEGLGPCSPSGLCADILNPIAIGDARADATGHAELQFTVPNAALDREVWVQAIVLDSPPDVTQVVHTWVDRTDGDSDGVVDLFDNCLDTYNPDQIDADNDLAGAACDCDDLDPLRFPGAPETAGDGVDSNCDTFDDPSGPTPSVWNGTWTTSVNFAASYDVFGTLLTGSCGDTVDLVVSDAGSPQITGSVSCSGAGLSVTANIEGDFTGDVGELAVEAVYTFTAAPVPIPLTSVLDITFDGGPPEALSGFELFTFDPGLGPFTVGIEVDGTR